jgi:hypothetical protein
MAKRRKKTLGEVTKKDFIAIAETLCQHRATSSLVLDLASYFKSQNPHFDVARFQKATMTCKR